LRNPHTPEVGVFARGCHSGFSLHQKGCRIAHTVLYIEDDPANIRLVERLLELRPQIHLCVAMNTIDGLKAAIDEIPDLIVLDNHLPDGTGTDVLRQLAASPITSVIPVLMLTGDSRGPAAEELLATGAAKIIIKPFDVHHLLSVIDHFLP
jgi:CheY-like chemotaxis protein